MSTTKGQQPPRSRLMAIIDDVRAERRAQDAFWGDQSAKPDSIMLAILVEEVGEAATAVLRRDDPRSDRHRAVQHLRKELVQVAAVAIQWIEHLDGKK